MIYHWKLPYEIIIALQWRSAVLYSSAAKAPVILWFKIECMKFLSVRPGKLQYFLPYQCCHRGTVLHSLWMQKQTCTAAEEICGGNLSYQVPEKMLSRMYGGMQIREISRFCYRNIKEWCCKQDGCHSIIHML